MKPFRLALGTSAILFAGSTWADGGGDPRIFTQNEQRAGSPGPNTIFIQDNEPTSLSVPKPKAILNQDSVGPAFVPKMIIRDPNLPERVPVNR